MSDEKVPRDEHGNECDGICENCGDPMVLNPTWPWCPKCTAPKYDEPYPEDGRTRSDYEAFGG